MDQVARTPILIGPEAVFAWRQDQRHLAGGIGYAAVVGVGRPVEGVDVQASLRRAVGISAGSSGKSRHLGMTCMSCE